MLIGLVARGVATGLVAYGVVEAAKRLELADKATALADVALTKAGECIAKFEEYAAKAEEQAKAMATPPFGRAPQANAGSVWAQAAKFGQGGTEKEAS